MNKNLFVLVVVFPIILHAQNHKIQGLLFDSINQAPVDYANIGIKGKNLVTVSNDSGFFKLEIPDKFLKDSLTFSRIGYATKKIGIEKLVDEKNLGVCLERELTGIEEAKIVSRKLKRRKKGNKVRKSIIKAWGGFYADSARLGHEIGNVIRLPDKTIFLKDFNFHVSWVKADSVKLRLNVYDYSHGFIGDNLLNENVYFVVTKKDIGDYRIDLCDLKISVCNDIFVAIENVAGYIPGIKPPKKNGVKQPICTMQFRATMTGSKGYYRNVSLGNWEEFPAALSTCFWVTILK